MKRRVFISNALGEERHPFGVDNALRFGAAHYSWKIVASLYERGLKASGLEVARIVRPEIYQANLAHYTLGLRHDDLHIAVKPIEHLRSMPAVKNIFISGWEFPELSNKSFGGDPFNNHLSIMLHADQIWCWTGFTASNLKAAGLHCAVVMPPPVIFSEKVESGSIKKVNSLALNPQSIPTEADFVELGEILHDNKDNAVFLSILNPWDKRKQLKTMLAAFIEAADKNDKMLLIVKLVIDNVGTCLANIQEIARSILKIEGGLNKRIVFISESLSEGQMLKLIKSADYYLCTSSAEGLNLPLIEAMAQGVVPVSVDSTAMADYINKENALIIGSNAEETEGAYHGLHEHMVTTHFPPVYSSVVSNILKAASLDLNVYEQMSENAIYSVNAKYSVNAFVDKFNGLAANDL